MEPTPTIVSPTRVLIVDDAATDRKILRRKLEEKGFEIIEAHDGTEALEILKREPVSAIVSDILMPRLDGYRLCAAIRHDNELRHIRCVLHTSSYTSLTDETLAYRFGADAFLRKPASAADLVSAIQNESRSDGESATRSLEETEQLDVLSQYSDALVHKLEEKNAELQGAAERLSATNKTLLERTQQLELTKLDLQRLNEELEKRVQERTGQLETANRELEQFSAAVAHDLRAPLRNLTGYAAILSAECRDRLSDECKLYLDRIPIAASRMSGLIEDLMRLSRVTRTALRRTRVDLSQLAGTVASELRNGNPERSVTMRITSEITAECDAALVLIALENLLGNAWKFTTKVTEPSIEFGQIPETETIFYVRDNGIGFDMGRAHQLFSAFIRLHSQADFPGTGIGLATVKRIINRHGGRIWAESTPGRGATFFFTLPPAKKTEAGPTLMMR